MTRSTASRQIAAAREQADRMVAAVREQTSVTAEQTAMTVRLERTREAGQASAFRAMLEAAMARVLAEAAWARSAYPQFFTQLAGSGSSVEALAIRDCITKGAFAELRGACVRQGSPLTGEFLDLEREIDNFASQCMDEMTRNMKRWALAAAIALAAGTAFAQAPDKACLDVMTETAVQNKESASLDVYNKCVADKRDVDVDSLTASINTMPPAMRPWGLCLAAEAIHGHVIASDDRTTCHQEWVVWSRECVTDHTVKECAFLSATVLMKENDLASTPTSDWGKTAANSKADPDPITTAINIATAKMHQCLRQFPKPNDGTENEVAKVIDRYISVCGQELLHVVRASGTSATDAGPMAWVRLDVYQTMGCIYTDADDPDAPNKPDGTRPISCH